MSLIAWEPAGPEGYKGFPVEPEPIKGLTFLAHWFGEDVYDPEALLWLQLYDGPNGRFARMRGYKKARLYLVTEEHVDDAAGYLGWEDWESKLLADERGRDMWEKAGLVDRAEVARKRAENARQRAGEKGGKTWENWWFDRLK